jgi:hypothetical protein
VSSVSLLAVAVGAGLDDVGLDVGVEDWVGVCAGVDCVGAVVGDGAVTGESGVGDGATVGLLEALGDALAVAQEVEDEVGKDGSAVGIEVDPVPPCPGTAEEGAAAGVPVSDSYWAGSVLGLAAG